MAKRLGGETSRGRTDKGAKRPVTAPRLPQVQSFRPRCWVIHSNGVGVRVRLCFCVMYMLHCAVLSSDSADVNEDVNV